MYDQKKFFSSSMASVPTMVSVVVVAMLARESLGSVEKWYGRIDRTIDVLIW